MKLTRINALRRMQVLASDRFVLVEVVRDRGADHAIRGLVRAGIMMPTTAASQAGDGLPIEAAVALARDIGRRGGESELFVYDPNDRWKPG